MKQDRPGRREIPLGFTPENVTEGQHICYVFNDDRERRKVMAKYLESGVLAGEKVLCLVDAMTPEEMIRSMEELGIDMESQGHRLHVADAASGYCPSGVFRIEEMLTLIKAFYHNAVDRDGHTGARGTGEMSWCLKPGLAEEEAVLEYEARLNQVLKAHPYTACCQYDARLFSGGLIMDVLSVHPVMIVRGQLVKNPFFIDPDLFLETYRARKHQGTGV